MNAGASGPSVAETLIKVVQAGHPFHHIAELLIDSGASLQYKEGRALETAVVKGDLSMLKILLRGSPTESDLAKAFERASKTFGRNTYDLMSTLISHGAKGMPLDRVLVSAVQLHENKIIELLLDHKARTDYNDAQALQIAVSTGALDVVDVILRKGWPSSDSMRRVFPLIPKRPPRLRHDLTRMLLDTEVSSGILPVQLGAALCDVLHPPSQIVDTDLVKLLIGAGADVNFNGGQCVRTIVASGNIEMLKRVIGAKAQRSSISSAIPQAMTIPLHSTRLEIINLLLNNGASGPNVAQALVTATAMGHQELGLINSLLKASESSQVGTRALTNAVMFCSKEIVESIITKGDLNQQSREEGFQSIFKRKVWQGLEKAEVILRLGVGVDHNSVNIALVEELTNRERIDPTLVKLLLQHGARCDYADGKALELAFDSGDSALLQTILIRDLDPRILAQKVLLAMQIQLRQRRYDTVSSLLRAGAAGPEVNNALVHEICGSAVRDQSLIRLLVDHGAEVSPTEGALVRNVINDPLRLDLLRLLMMAKDWTRAARHAISPAMTLTDADDRYEVLEVLVGSGSGGFEVDTALTSAVMETPPNYSVISLLLRQGASVNFQEGQALKTAVQRTDVTTIEILLEKDPKTEFVTAAFDIAMEIPGDRNVNGASTRLSIIKLFTNAGIRGSQQVHVAVIRAVQQRDYKLLAHLLEHEGDARFGDGKSILIAATKLDVHSLRLLAKDTVCPDIYSNAFRKLVQKQERWQRPEDFAEVARILLTGGAVGPAIGQTLLEAVDSNDSRIAGGLVESIAQNSPLSVNFDGGKALQVAVRHNRMDMVISLLGCGPDTRTLSAALTSIFLSDASESCLIDMFKAIRSHLPGSIDDYFNQQDPMDSPLYQTLHRHSDKPGLLATLLENGVTTEIEFRWELISELGTENVSPLIWLLCQDDSRANQRTMNLLLRHGGECNEISRAGSNLWLTRYYVADPTSRTRCSGTNALMINMNLTSLTMLLSFVKDKTAVWTGDVLGRTPLYHATSRGNMEVMKKLLDWGVPANDESLHIAAKLLRAPAIQLLLDRGADVDRHGSRTCNGRTALAELCCREDPNFNRAHLRQAIEVILGAAPDLDLLVDNKSVLFLALDSGYSLLTVTSLLEAHPNPRKWINKDCNILRMQNGYCYSATMYVRHHVCLSPQPNHLQRCCDRHDCPAGPLLNVLKDFRCQDRFWDEQGGQSQPEGACGFPEHISKTIERDRMKKEEESERAQERNRRAEFQALLDADEEAELKRERKRIDVREKERRLEREDADSRRRAEAAEAEQRAAAERRRLNSMLEGRRFLAAQEEQALRRLEKIKTDERKARAKTETDVLREKQKLLESVRTTATQLALSSREAGMILGEVTDGRGLLMDR